MLSVLMIYDVISFRTFNPVLSFSYVTIFGDIEVIGGEHDSNFCIGKIWLVHVK